METEESRKGMIEEKEDEEGNKIDGRMGRGILEEEKIGKERREE